MKAVHIRLVVVILLNRSGTSLPTLVASDILKTHVMSLAMQWWLTKPVNDVHKVLLQRIPPLAYAGKSGNAGVKPDLRLFMSARYAI